ncbi:MAG: nucleotidyltransferase family protein [Candidatus Latescibacterota bacterium]
MRRQEVLDTLATHRVKLQEMGIGSLSLFGSVARDEAVDTNDIDLLVAFNRPVGLFHFARVRRTLSELLSCPVDLVTQAALRDEMRDDILKEAVPVELRTATMPKIQLPIFNVQYAMPNAQCPITGDQRPKLPYPRRLPC